MNIIHIGLPKTGTTTLQKEIFPHISKRKKTLFLENNDLNKILNTSDKKNLKEKKIKGKNFFLSYEGLISPEGNPYFFREKSLENKLIFGYDCHILITIRDPESFLNSVYLQNINTFNLKREKDYFLSKKEFAKKMKQRKKIDYINYWCLEMYKLNDLINIYKKLFKNVTILKMEAFNNPELIKRVFNINNTDAKKISQIFNQKKINQSPGKIIVKIAFFLEGFLNLFNLSLKELYNISKKYQNKVDNSIFRKITILRKLFKGILYLINFRYIYTFFLKKIIKEDKYKCDFTQFKYYNLKEEEKFFKNFPLIKQYKNK